MIQIKNDFNLRATVTCGQIFRYFECKNGFIIILKDRVIKIIEYGDEILIESSNEENLLDIINDYFDLNRDYTKLENDIIKMDKKIESAIVYSKGLRMIHQDPLETIIAYIISQNNRVPSIANSLNLISSRYGEKIEFMGNTYYLFPSIEVLSNLCIEDYRNCKVGFRDKYLFNIVNSIFNGVLVLDNIKNMDSTASLNYLMSFNGIGPKVASCILLFAYQKFDVYPIDTWVKKFMKDEYSIEGEKNIRQFTLEKYKEYSGLAIQYMFNYKRNKNNLQI